MKRGWQSALMVVSASALCLSALAGTTGTPGQQRTSALTDVPVMASQVSPSATEPTSSVVAPLTTSAPLPGSDRLDLVTKSGLPTSDDGVGAWRDTCSSRSLSTPDCISAALITLPVAERVDALSTAMRYVQSVSSSCHEPAHKIGRLAYADVRDLEKALLAGNSVCEDGYYHGVFEEWGIEEGTSIKSVDPNLCVKLRAAKPGVVCEHGFGHGLWTGLRDVPQALRACRALTGAGLQGCVSGVTMSFIQERKNPFKSPEEVLEFCKTYEEDIRVGCISETAGFLLRVVGDAAAVPKACAILDEIGGRKFCVQAAGMLLPLALKFDYDKIRAVCAGSGLEVSCLYGAQEQIRLRPSATGLAVRDRICTYAPDACKVQK